MLNMIRAGKGLKNHRRWRSRSATADGARALVTERVASSVALILSHRDSHAGGLLRGRIIIIRIVHRIRK